MPSHLLIKNNKVTKMKKNIKFIFTLLFISILYSCTKDFIIKDIKKDTVKVISPADGLSTPNNLVTFWWDELDGAENYNLQIVKPNFNSVIQLLIDTIITTNKFNYTFTPGTYQWRIKAINGGGNTLYTTRTIVIDTTSNLNLTSVLLGVPLTAMVTSSNSITFSWNALPSANYYELQLTPPSGVIITIPNITSTSYIYTFTTVLGSEEKYTWSVIAKNSFSQTQNNTVRGFKIDRKIPLSPSISSPNTYSTSVRDTINLVWTRNQSSTDIQYDVISIGADSLFAVVLANQIINSSIPSPRLNTIYSYTGTPIPIWWKVTSSDSVGNISNPSISKRLYLK